MFLTIRKKDNNPFTPTASHKLSGPRLKLERKKAIHSSDCMSPGTELFRYSYQDYKPFHVIPVHIASSKFHALEIPPRLSPISSLCIYML